jgi:hypothetical protein
MILCDEREADLACGIESAATNRRDVAGDVDILGCSHSCSWR